MINRWLLQQPARLLLQRVDRIEPVPGNISGRHSGGGIDGGFVGSKDSDEVAVADNLDLPLAGTADRGLVDLGDRAVRAAGAQHALHHAVELHVVDEDRCTKYLGCKIDAGRIPTNDAVIVRRLDGCAGGRRSRQVDGISKRPVILPSRLAITEDSAVFHRKISCGAAQA